MLAQLKLYAVLAVAAAMCGLVVLSSHLYVRVSTLQTEKAALTKQVEQFKKDKEALDEALKTRDAALAAAAARTKAVRSAVDPLRNTEADPEISPIMRKYIEELSK